MRINIDGDLIIRAIKLCGIKANRVLVEKDLQLFVALESQKRLKDLRGKIALDEEAFK